jgi:hypothetical protein
MGPLFAMAGPAEAGEPFALTIAYGGLLLVDLTAAIGLFARSRAASGVSLVLVLLVTLLFQPWEAFRPFPSDDPDAQHWVAAWRGFCWWWGVALVAAVAAYVLAFGFPAEPAAPAGPQGTPDHPQQTGGV